MCALYAEDVYEEAIFERLLFLIRDWEHDEKPDNLYQTVNTILFSKNFCFFKLKIINSF